MTDSLFFDINNILMESEKVQAELKADCFNLEKLEFQTLTTEPYFPDLPNPEKNDSEKPKEEPNVFVECGLVDCLPKGTKFKLPIWMALGLSNKQFIGIQIQSFFDQEFISTSISFPEGLNLKEKCYYYYEVGTILSLKLKRPIISEYLGKIFLVRIKEIFKILFNESDSTSSNFFLQKLSNLEEQFYEDCKSAFNMFKVWRTNKILEELQFKSHINRRKIKISNEE